MKSFIVFTVLKLIFFTLPLVKAANIATLEIPKQSSYPIGLPKRATWKVHNNLNMQKTGFFIEEDLFVTSFHIIQGQKPLDHASDEEFIENLRLSQDGNPPNIKVKEIIAVSAIHNLALLKTEKVQYHLSLKQNSPQASESFAIPTYSKGSFTEIRKTGNMLSENGSFYIFPIEYPAIDGSSGAPILDNKRQVAGVLFSGYMRMAYAITLDQLKAFITGTIGLNCSDFVNAESCIKREIENLKRSAEEGDPAAQFNMGRMYDYVYTSEQNLKLAFQWYEKAALQSFVAAEYKVAIMYANGLGVEKNSTLASEWYDKANEQVNGKKDLNFSTCHDHFSE